MQKLTPDQKKLIAERIATIDPKGEIVSLAPNSTFTSGTITYNKASGIVLHENISKLTDEEYVRAYLVAHLTGHLRYPITALELEKVYTIGRPSPTRAQIDVRVLDPRVPKKPKTFMLIEAKKPDEFESYSKLIEDQLFSTGNQEYANGCRYIVWYSLDLSSGDIRDKCIVVDLRKYHEHKSWIEAGEPGHNLDLPIEYGTVRKHRYVKGETELETDLTREDLTRMQKDFHNVLWGGAKMGDTDVFNNLLKMLLAKIYDEQTTEDGKPYQFQIELKDGETETPVEITAKVNRIYQEALKRYFGYDDAKLASAVINENRFPPNKVAYVVERLESVSLTQNKFEDDVLGAFFEAIVRTGFKQEKGQFFTHTNIVRFVVHALELDDWAIEMINGNPPLLPYIIDSSCGSGTFIIEAMKMITHSVLHAKKDGLKKSRTVRDYVQEWFQPDAENKNMQNRWAREFIYGAEDNEDLATAVKVNMILHGDGNANIQKADGLVRFENLSRPRLQVSKVNPGAPYKFPVNEQFDCVISNPPFSLKEESRTLAEYGNRFAYAAQKNSENLFIERWYQLLKPGGRMGVVLPDSVFDTNENLYIRMFLYRFFVIKAVVSLPQITFQPYTPTKTSLLFAVKKTGRQVDEWDTAWRKASNEYGRLRGSRVVQFVLENERLRNGLIDLANRAEVEWYPAENLLGVDSLPSAIRKKIGASTKRGSNQRKRLAKMLRDFRGLLAKRTLETVDAKEATATLTRLLRDKAPSAKLALSKLVEAAYDDIVEAAELNHTEDPKGQPYCNAWWCFGEVTSQKQFDHEIFFAEAENVGYKRTTRHPEGIPQPNDLFREDKNGEIIIDTASPKTILDHLRSKKFFFSKTLNLDETERLRVFHRYFRDCASGFSLRFSARFMHPKFALLSAKHFSPEGSFKLKSLCARAVTRGIQPEYEESDILVAKTGTLKSGFIDWEEAQSVSEGFYEDVKQRAGLRLGDILVSSTGVGSLGKVDVFDRKQRAIADGHISIVRLRDAKIDPEFIAHLMRHRFVQWQIEQGLTGATNQIDIYPPQIEALRLPRLSEKVRSKLAAQLKAISAKISAERSRLKHPGEIINQIICREFKYPLKEQLERASEISYSKPFSAIAAGFTLRDSAKFHHPRFELTSRFFAKTPHDRVKAFVAIPIRLGATVTKADLVDGGEAFYIHPGSTKSQGVIDLADCHRISLDFFEKNKNRFALRPGDVVINRSGEAVGKVALFNDEERAIASDFTMRVRFNQKMNPRFGWYFFRSIIFQTQIDREQRGTSLPNIFPPQVERMLIVSCPKPQQDSIVREIADELEILARAQRSVVEKRAEINALIDAAIAAIELPRLH